MELLLNDLSFHGQFADAAAVADSLRGLMAMKALAARHGRSIQCRRGLATAQTIGAAELRATVHGLSLAERQAVIAWVGQAGPFWTDARTHTGDDWLEHGGDIVTDSGLGEAAWCHFSGLDRRLISVVPSNWTQSPLAVDHRSAEATLRTAQIDNYFDLTTLLAALERAPLPMVTWVQMEASIRSRCQRLTILAGAFQPLQGIPFAKAAAERLVVLFGVLDDLKGCYGPDGARTAEGHRLHADFFARRAGDGGRGAPFSNSSDPEIQQQAAAMTFRLPGVPGGGTLCSWHGKTQTPQLRFYFSWPMSSDDPTYVVHVGKSLTHD